MWLVSMKQIKNGTEQPHFDIFVMVDILILFHSRAVQLSATAHPPKLSVAWQ